MQWELERMPGKPTAPISRWFRTTALAMAASMLMASLPLRVVQAELVTTEQVVNQTDDGERDRVAAFLARDDVQQQMVALGVDPAEAKARIDGLSAAEIDQIAGQLDRLPSGEGFVGPIVAGIVIVFLVLLLTDILGFTDVFPFVKKTASGSRT